MWRKQKDGRIWRGTGTARDAPHRPNEGSAVLVLTEHFQALGWKFRHGSWRCQAATLQEGRCRKDAGPLAGGDLAGNARLAAATPEGRGVGLI